MPRGSLQDPGGVLLDRPFVYHALRRASRVCCGGRVFYIHAHCSHWLCAGMPYQTRTRRCGSLPYRTIRKMRIRPCPGDDTYISRDSLGQDLWKFRRSKIQVGKLSWFFRGSTPQTQIKTCRIIIMATHGFVAKSTPGASGYNGYLLHSFFYVRARVLFFTVCNLGDGRVLFATW